MVAAPLEKSVVVANRDIVTDFFLFMKFLFMKFPVKISSYKVAILEQAKCFDCNEDIFGINDSNSVFKDVLKISFHGQKDPFSGVENGKLTLGNLDLFYQTKK